MHRIFVFLPCFNEEANIGDLISEWLDQNEELQKMGFDLSVIGIDDKSTDNTRQIIQYYANSQDHVSMIAHEQNLNLGGCLMTGFQFFLDQGQNGDLCVFMDGDNTHNPKYVFPMLEKIQSGAQCVIASRYCSESKVIGVPRNRVFLSDCAKIYFHSILHVSNVKDYTCGYRIYSYDIISKAMTFYGKKLVEMKNFTCMMEVLYKLSRIGCRFNEIPFILRYDKKAGTSKMKIFNTIKDSVLTALKLRLFHSKK